MKNVTYDRLKVLALVWIPAVGALYFGLAGIWHLPKAEEVVGTITVLDTFLGTVLHISSNQYQNNPDGTLVINPDPEQEMLKLEMNHDLEGLAAKDNLNIKVNNQLS